MNNKNFILNNSAYALSNELVELGYVSDDTGVYIPYTIKNTLYHDSRNIYLKISRTPSEEPEVIYTFVKLEEGLFYPLEQYVSSELLSGFDNKLKRSLGYTGKRCLLNSRKGGFVELADSFLDNICAADGLDILKKEDYDFTRIRNSVNLTVIGEKNSHHNFMDMRELVKLTTGQEPEYSYPKQGYDMFLCPFHDDHKASAHVHKHIFGCYKNNQWQLDQTAYLKLLYNLDTVQEVESKFQELLSQ